MDDIIDLELEKIDAIIDKINSDPEPEELKMVERNIWLNIRKKAKEGRRTGIGITAEGDMLAAMGLRYGTEEATTFSVDVHKTLALEAYKSSTYLAKERGAFAIYDSEREKNNPSYRESRGRSRTLFQYGEVWQKKYRSADHRPNRHNKYDDPDNIGHRTCFRCLLQSPT